MDDLKPYIILFLVWLVSTILVRTILTKTRTKARSPPTPFALPIIGHLHLLSPLPHQAFQKLSNRHGPLIHLTLGSAPCIVVSSPEVAKQFFKSHEASFSKRPQSVVVDHLSYPSADFTLAPYGPYFQFMKRLCMSRLLGGQTLSQLLPVRSDEIKRLLKLMVKKAESKEPVDVGRELTKLTSNVISRMVMSKRCAENDDEVDEVMKVVNESAEVVGTFNLSDFIWFCKNFDLQGIKIKGKKVHEKFDHMMEKIIKEHQEQRKEDGNGVKDLLDILLDISEDDSSENRLTMEHIKAFILDIFVAGTDTSSITIQWALAELINHPKIMKRSREEIDSVVGKTRLVEESDIANLPYLQAIVKETLRLHPAGPIIVREASEDFTVNGYDISEKTRIFINVWAINRNSKSWENPLEFNPERFLSMNQLDVRGQHFHFLPFGSGRRGCPGISLGMHVVQTSLAAMVQCFEWNVDGIGGIVDMEEAPGMTLPRAHPLLCVPVIRFSPIPL
ncbi:3,9-dihydroxypterocarpan 6A-monooxygenase-like [Humulus lupulus]|uniref:3,9-dihydroxypterocarpan 6A-monooxygenase-like n=1 Tax=Humulus lupulus TaxID=3486 RepID=UPI002B4033C5|nr:3,9-dihydroxypterocarpan 6A-monooxygenase-like [Humulus lupulus]